MLFGAVTLIPLPAVNITYTAVFDQSPGNVTFAFDRNDAFPASSSQPAAIEGNQATILLDPLNQDSKSLNITALANDLAIKSLEVNVAVPHNAINYGVLSIPGKTIENGTDADSSTFSLSADQLTRIRATSQQKSAVKPVLWTVLSLIYLMVLVRMTALKRLSKPYFAVLLFAALCIAVFLANLWASSGAPSHYRLLAAALVLILVAALIVNYLAGTRCGIKGRRAIILADYGGILAFALLQARYFMQQLGGFPDEPAHLSYIAYMKLHGGWLPDFSAMRIYHDTQPGMLSLAENSANQFNYLGHPPLYYKIMSLVGALRVNGNNVSYDLTRLRIISLGIGVAGLLLLFYIAYTRLQQVPLMQLLFALIVISPANMVFGMSGLSNDTLALLTVSIFTLGIIRFAEARCDWVTYLLIAIGISATVLTKLTAGMIVVTAALLVLFYTVVIKRKPKMVRQTSFYLTLPIYLIPIAYFLTLYSRFHTIQPSYQRLAFSEYVTSGMYAPIADRTPMAPSAYAQYFFTQFLNNWSSIVGHVPVTRPGTTPFTFDAIAVTLIFLAPLGLFLFRRSRRQRYFVMGYIAILVVTAYQFKTAATGFYSHGYLGGTQARYYQCAIGLFALSIIWMLSQLLLAANSQEDTTMQFRPSGSGQAAALPQLSALGTAVVIGLSLLLLYDGFISTFLLSGR